MAMLSLGAIGILLMMLNGLLNAAMIVTGKVLQTLEWPYFRLMCVSSGLIVICFTAAVWRARVTLPSSNQAKWLVLRGMFGAATFLLQISAVRIGAAPGDAAALASINTVVAALLGRAFLGEKLQWMHGIAVLCSMSGATLISKPSFLFDSSSVEGVEKWIGFSLAAASGLTQACVFISARKSNKSSLLLLNVSPAFFCVLAFSLVPLTPYVDDSSLAPIERSPHIATAILAAFVFIQFGAMTTNSAASSWCPAAVSATVNTAAKMVSSYIAQSLLFGVVPESLTICGAALMLSAVVIMAIARLPARQRSAATAAPTEPEVQNSGDVPDDDDNESLASFIAAEFVEMTPHEKAVRMRRPGAQDLEARQIGAVLSAVVASI
jgi:drug/metabolite transporter (DMT)-like permease